MKIETPRNLTRYIEHEAIDQSGKKVGKLHSLWADKAMGNPVIMGALGRLQNAEAPLTL